MNINRFSHIYFIGIGGIGMSALARYFISNGKKVAGYDKTKTEITEQLQVLGAGVNFEDHLEVIPKQFKNSENTLVVYTPAIPTNHLQLNFFKSNDFEVVKRSEILGAITKNTFCLAVAGTHGKTTTSSMIVHLMKMLV